MGQIPPFPWQRPFRKVPQEQHGDSPPAKDKTVQDQGSGPPSELKDERNDQEPRTVQVGVSHVRVASTSHRRRNLHLTGECRTRVRGIQDGEGIFPRFLLPNRPNRRTENVFAKLGSAEVKRGKCEDPSWDPTKSWYKTEEPSPPIAGGWFLIGLTTFTLILFSTHITLV